MRRKRSPPQVNSLICSDVRASRPSLVRADSHAMAAARRSSCCCGDQVTVMRSPVQPCRDDDVPSTSRTRPTDGARHSWRERNDFRDPTATNGRSSVQAPAVKCSRTPRATRAGQPMVSMPLGAGARRGHRNGDHERLIALFYTSAAGRSMQGQTHPPAHPPRRRRRTPHIRAARTGGSEAGW